MSILQSLSQRYRRQDLWKLFLICALPQHAWTLALALRDVPWLIERTNAWDAISVVSYGLLFSFIESVLIFLVMAVLGFLVSTKWERDRRLALLSILILVAAFWAMASYLFAVLKLEPSGRWVDWLIQTGHPLRIWTAAIVVISVAVSLSFLVPAFLVLRSTRALRLTNGMLERLSLLSVFYLALDSFGLAIIVIRNLE